MIFLFWLCRLRFAIRYRLLFTSLNPQQKENETENCCCGISYFFLLFFSLSLLQLSFRQFCGGVCVCVNKRSEKCAKFVLFLSFERNRASTRAFRRIFSLSISLYVWPKRGVNEGDASSSSIPTYTHTAKGHSTEHNPSRPTAALQLQRQKSRARFERLATCNMNLTRNAYKTRIACLAWGLLGITLVHIWFGVWSSSGLMPDKTKKKRVHQVWGV